MKQVALWLVCGGTLLVHSAEEGQLPMSSDRAVVTPAFYTGIIHLQDLNTSPSGSDGMYTIRFSGRYAVSDFLSLAPASNNLSGIKIVGSNVTLNLNDTTITQRSSNTATGVIGVEVAASLSNVYVYNGAVNGLNTSSSVGIKVNPRCTNVRLNDLIVHDCSRGVHFAGTSLNEITSARVENVAVSGATNTAGIHMVYCNNCWVKNCVANDNVITGGAGYGFQIENSEGCHFIDCSAQRNTNAGTSASGGIYFDTVKGSVVKRFRSLSNGDSSNTSSTGTFGIRLNASEGMVFDGCVVAYSVSGAQGARVYGVFANTATALNGNVYKNCHIYGSYATNNTNGNNEVRGLEIQEKGSFIIKNRFFGQNTNEVSSTGSVEAYGLYVTGTTQLAVINNELLFNTAEDIGRGIDDQTANSTVLYIGNFAAGNSTANYSIDPSGAGSFPSQEGNYANLSNLASKKRSLENIFIDV